MLMTRPLCTWLIPAGRLYIDRDEQIRFRVESVEWTESEPIPPSIRDQYKADARERERAEKQWIAAGNKIEDFKDESKTAEPEKNPIDLAGYKIMVGLGGRCPLVPRRLL
jgi:hypothetical protein